MVSISPIYKQPVAVSLNMDGKGKGEILHPVGRTNTRSENGRGRLHSSTCLTAISGK